MRSSEKTNLGPIKGRTNQTNLYPKYYFNPQEKLLILSPKSKSPKQKIFFSSIERTDKNERMKDTIIKDIMSLVRLKNETNRKKK